MCREGFSYLRFLKILLPVLVDSNDMITVNAIIVISEDFKAFKIRIAAIRGLGHRVLCLVITVVLQKRNAAILLWRYVRKYFLCF